jgi:predicted RNA-binding protein (virulence factor B family)
MEDKKYYEDLELELSNETITINEMDEVNLVVLRPTDIGYTVMVNDKHLGMLHYNEVFIELFAGEKLRGFVKTIHEDHKLDVVLGRAGFAKVEDEAGKILEKLKQHNGFLPFHDKSDPEDIYDVFGMSKKTFKMTIGNLYKQKLITIAKDGITLIKK